MKKQTILNLLNSNIKNIEEKIGNKIDCIGSQENLKLYDVSDYCCENDIDIELFNDFCQFEYDNFIETLKENDIELGYIGRTSTFRVQGDFFFNDDRNYYTLEEIEKLSLNEKIGYLIENYFYCNYNYIFNFEYDKKGNIINFDYEELKNYILSFNDSKEVLKNIYEELFRNNVIEELNNIVSTYKYIEEFKNNQLECFKEFLQCIEE